MQDRSIEIRMERKKRSINVSPLRATPPAQREEFQRKILRWKADYGNQLEVLDAPAVQQLNDRATDNWLALLQVARLAGQLWLDTALKAMIALNPQEGYPETEADNKNINSAVLARLQRIFFETIQAPARNLAEAQARAAGKSEQEIETAGQTAAKQEIEAAKEAAAKEVP